MKVIKNGDIARLTKVISVCNACGCVFESDVRDWTVCDANDKCTYARVNCPDCNTTRDVYIVDGKGVDISTYEDAYIEFQETALKHLSDYLPIEDGTRVAIDED